MDFYKILMGGVGVGMSNFDRLFAEKHGGGSIQEITGTLPLAVRSLASQVLENYRIYGASGGVGDKMANLLPKTQDLLRGYIDISGWVRPQQEDCQERVSNYIPINPEEQYTLSAIPQFPYIGTAPYDQPWRAIAWYDVNKNFISRPSGIVARPLTQTAPSNAYYARVSFRTFGIDVKSMFTKTETAPETYIPYGYKLPITVTSNGTTTDYPIYIGDSQLMEGEYVDYEKQKIYKLIDGVLTPTDPSVPFPDITLPRGTVTIDIEGDFKPQATVKGLISPTN